MSLTIANQNSGWRAVKRIISAAALAGLVAGLCLTAAQKLQVSSLIHQAEVYEDAARGDHQTVGHGADPTVANNAATDMTAAGHPLAHAHLHEHAPSHAAAHSHEHTHSHEAAHSHEHAHFHTTSTAGTQVEAVQHEAKEWRPADGSERLLYTVLANVSMAVGFGLLLAAALYLHGSVASVRAGLVWGAAGYLVFFVAPSMGLRPELPGAEAAPLAARQLWWLLTVVAAAAGLALLILARPRWKLVGLAVLALPYLVGAPRPEIAGGSAPVALSHAFLLATAFANGVLWLVLGSTVAYIYRKTGE